MVLFVIDGNSIKENPRNQFGLIEAPRQAVGDIPRTWVSQNEIVRVESDFGQIRLGLPLKTALPAQLDPEAPS